MRGAPAHALPHAHPLPWRLALAHTTGPTCLALTRQNLPLLRREPSDAGFHQGAPDELPDAQVNAP